MGRWNIPLLKETFCFIPQGKLVQLLRNVQTEQFSKLQQRYQLQIDLLEDVRYVCVLGFTVTRSLSCVN